MGVVRIRAGGKIPRAPRSGGSRLLRGFMLRIGTRSFATAKSTARPSYLVGVLYDIYRETNNRSTANQPLVRNWP